MGCWMAALGRLTIVPEPDDKLIEEYIHFCKSHCPDGYREDEIFSNSWYFDEENRLASGIGKFAEPSVWYACLKKEFFEPRGYMLYGDPVFAGEGEFDIWSFGEKRYREQKLWWDRVREMSSKNLVGNS